MDHVFFYCRRAAEMTPVRKNASPTIPAEGNRRFHRTSYFRRFKSRFRNFRDAAPNTMPIAMQTTDAPSTFMLRITSPKQSTCGIMPSHEEENVVTITASRKMTRPGATNTGFCRIYRWRNYRRCPASSAGSSKQQELLRAPAMRVKATTPPSSIHSY